MQLSRVYRLRRLSDSMLGSAAMVEIWNGVMHAFVNWDDGTKGWIRVRDTQVIL